jgi:transporter family protein
MLVMGCREAAVSIAPCAKKWPDHWVISRMGEKMKPLIAPWILWAGLSAIFAAMTAIFGKIGVEQINSDFATLIRTVIILVIVAVIVTASGAWQPLASVSRKTYLFLLLSGLATGASWLCYYRALKLGPASGVAPIDKMSVLLVALFAVLFLGERLQVHNWIGIVLIALGVVLVAAPG